MLLLTALIPDACCPACKAQAMTTGNLNSGVVNSFLMVNDSIDCDFLASCFISSNSSSTSSYPVSFLIAKTLIIRKTLENTEEEIKKGQSRETGNIGYTRRIKTNKHNTIYVGYHHMQANTNNTNKTCVFLQTIGGKDEQSIFFISKS